MSLFRRKRADERVSEEEADEAPRDANAIFGGGHPSLPSGSDYVDAWRDAWNHPGRAPSHVYDQSGRLYPLRVPMTKCPESDCARLFSDPAVLDEHVRRDHGGIVRRIARVVRRETR
jgi:hypothetical protein